MAYLVVLLIIVAMALGAPLFAVFAVAGAFGATSTSDQAGRTFWGDFGGQISDINSLATGEQATILSTIPLFIFAGYLMAESKTAQRLVDVTRAGLGWLPGSLAVVTIVACALFTTFTGASGVTIVALGGLLLPALLKENYPERFSVGLVSGTGSVGLLFPPAVPLIIYGTIYGLNAQSRAAAEGGADLKLIQFTTDRFMFAGIVPGLVLVGILCGYAIIIASLRGGQRHKFDGAALARGLKVALPEIILPFLIIGGLAKGLQLPEVASLTVVYVFILEAFVYRDLSVRSLWRLTREAMALVGAIFIIIFTAYAFTNYLTTAGVPNAVLEWVTTHIDRDSPWLFLLALNLVLLLVGMTMDIFSAILVVVPLIVGPAQAYGIDPFHLGVIFLLNLEIGYLTPPVGLNLFITSFAFRRPVLEVTRATLPFLGCMILALILVTYIPALTVVPPPERRGLISALVSDIELARQKVTAIATIELGPGKVLRKSDCDAFDDSPDGVIQRGACETLFIEVSNCRKEANGEVGTRCETELIEEYVEESDEEDDDWDLDDLDDEDEENETGSNETGAGQSPAAVPGQPPPATNDE